MEETPAPEVEQTEIEGQIAYLTNVLGQVNEWFFAVTFSEDWKSYTLEEQIAFRNAVEILFGVGTLHREKLDSDIWKGHANGSVNPLVTSIRKQREGDTPGKKAAVPTAESLLAKRLKK